MGVQYFRRTVSTRSGFFIIFGAACREYFPFAETRRELHYDYAFCPVECPENGYNAKRVKPCDDCEVRRVKEDFKTKLEAEILRRTGHVSFRFDELLETIYRVAALEDEDRKTLTVKQSILLGAFLAEKDRYRRERDEEKEKTKS